MRKSKKDIGVLSKGNSRALMQHCKEQGIPLYLCGIEKSGAILSHVARMAKDDNISDGSFCLLSHDYIEENIRKRASRRQPYGLRPNWGEKLGVKIDGETCILVNILVGMYNRSGGAPFPCDLIGSDRILSAIPGLVCRLYEIKMGKKAAQPHRSRQRCGLSRLDGLKVRVYERRCC